jgi:hypothetical protein
VPPPLAWSKQHTVFSSQFEERGQPSPTDARSMRQLWRRFNYFLSTDYTDFNKNNMCNLWIENVRTLTLDFRHLKIVLYALVSATPRVPKVALCFPVLESP